MPTDTIYGIVGLANNPKVVERIYQVKDRQHTKPFVILISDYSQLGDLGINLSNKDREYLETVWPGPTSVVTPTSKMEHLHRGKNTLAVRMPKDRWLKNLIDQTGPIVATSANIAEETYVHDLDVIVDKFKDSVDYISHQEISISAPSTIIDLNTRNVLR